MCRVLYVSENCWDCAPVESLGDCSRMNWCIIANVPQEKKQNRRSANTSVFYNRQGKQARLGCLSLPRSRSGAIQTCSLPTPLGSTTFGSGRRRRGHFGIALAIAAIPLSLIASLLFCSTQLLSFSNSTTGDTTFESLNDCHELVKYQ